MLPGINIKWALFLKVYIYGGGHGIKRRRGKKYSRRGERRGKEEEGRKQGRSRAGGEGTWGEILRPGDQSSVGRRRKAFSPLVHKAVVTDNGVAIGLSRLWVLSPVSLPNTEEVPVVRLAGGDGSIWYKWAELLPLNWCGGSFPRGVWAAAMGSAEKRPYHHKLLGLQSPGVLLLSGEGEGAWTHKKWSFLVHRFCTSIHRFCTSVHSCFILSGYWVTILCSFYLLDI